MNPLLVLGLFAAGMATTTRASASQPLTFQAEQTDWHVNDIPEFGPDGVKVGWSAGDPASQGNGNRPARYSNNSNYAYASAVGGRNPDTSWARWDMDNRVGTQEIQVFIPENHATSQSDLSHQGHKE